MQKITPRQNDVLQFVRETIAATHAPPTRAEIAKGLGMRSVNAANDHLKALVKKGIIEIIPGTSRGIRVIQDKSKPGLPVIGDVAAGQPLLAVENIQEYIQLPQSFFSPPADYVLRVCGMSMQKIGILDGDLVGVRQTPAAENGQIVVARLDDGVTVKRFEKTAKGVRLKPENDAFSVIEVSEDNDDFCIEGCVVGVLRKEM